MTNFNFLEVNSWLWIIWGASWITAANFVKETRTSEDLWHRLQHLIPLGIGFILIFHISGRYWIYGAIYSIESCKLMGTSLTFFGLAYAAWARIHLGKNWSGIITVKDGHKLIRSGPYRWTRHPIYTGFLLAVLGSAITAGTGDAFVGFVIMLAAYVRKINREEQVLIIEFGDEYVSFKKKVAGLFPFVY